MEIKKVAILGAGAVGAYMLEEVIGKSIGEDKIVHSLIKIASERKGNRVRFDAEGTIGVIYGEINPAHSRDRVEEIATPYNEFVYHTIKAMEEKNDGRFDYE